jgi:Spy/CpxP family protein refolding chaperone
MKVTKRSPSFEAIYEDQITQKGGSMKRNKKHLGSLGAVLIAMGLGTFPVYSQAGPGLRGQMMGGAPAVIMSPLLLLRALDLTADQHALIQEIRTNHRAAVQDLLTQLHAAQDNLANKLFAPGALQESQLMADTQQISQLRNQLAQERIRVMLEIRAVLTPDQLAKAAQLNQQMQSIRTQMRNLFTQAWQGDPVTFLSQIGHR